MKEFKFKLNDRVTHISETHAHHIWVVIARGFMENEYGMEETYLLTSFMSLMDSPFKRMQVLGNEIQLLKPVEIKK